ncbi:hypothetical protein HDE_00532 [Halotydeus destructor]|nr:hypothetical protein HDE_00532 [Halotydeus destructor]
MNFNNISYLLSSSTASRACKQPGLFMNATCSGGQWSNRLSCDLESTEAPLGVTLVAIASSAALAASAVFLVLKKLIKKKDKEETDPEPSYLEPTFAHVAHIGWPTVPTAPVDPAYAEVENDIYDGVRYVSYDNAVAMK